MNEDFLHYIWKFQQFNTFDFATTDGAPVQVIKTGRHNQDAGPDFLDARIRIGDTVWAGNVEIHLAASDWHKHQHHKDKAYDNVVLHVVYQHDADITTSSGEPISALCIKDMFDYQTFRYYKSWVKSAKFIPCEGMLDEVPSIVKSTAIENAAISRLKMKSSIWTDHLYETKGNKEEALYRVLLRSFGLKVNALPFEHLSRITPLELVRKNWDNLSMLEALFLGQAGFLDQAKSAHPAISKLKSDYDFLKAKYDLTPMPMSSWKLFRLRPQNFPQVRLAQIALFYHTWKSVGQRIIEIEELTSLGLLFDLSLSGDFWQNHYTLDKPSAPCTKSLGRTATVSIIINGVVPFLFALSDFNKDLTYRDCALSILEQLPAEKNALTRKYISLGFEAHNALDTQGMVHLKQFECDARKCLNCRVGIQIIKRYADAH